MTSISPARLRPHHFVCLRFYRGEGYSPSYVANLDAVLERARCAGAVVAEGADDICAACPGIRDGVCVWTDESEAEVRRIDALAARLLGLVPGEVVDWDASAPEVVAALREWSSSACTPCAWHTVCVGAIACALQDGTIP